MAEPAVPEKQADRRALSGEYAAFAQTDADGLHHLTLRVEGIHCAACIYAIESALSPLPGVKEARVNLSTRRLAITWEGDVAQADTFAQTVETLGYPVQPFDASRTPRMQEEEKLLLKAMAISGFAMGNIMLLSVALWSSDQAVMGVATRDLFHWITALIALPTIAYAGRPFFRSALMALRGGHTNMDVPISLALLLACGMSMVETLRHGEHAYFDSAVMLLFFLLIGRYLDARARGKARQNAQTLLDSMQGVAQVIEGETMRYLPIRELREGMQVRVAAGEKIPTDSRVLEGESEIDSSLMTGESTPAAVKPGDRVYGGTLNLHAPLLVEISKASEHSLLADIVRLMEKAEQGRARYVRLADRAARLYTPVVHSLALLTFLGWWLGMGIGWQPALLYAITVLIITCPCALGLAVPVVQVLASSWLMRRGILLKSGDALERLAIIDTAVFDKTGTLTQGKPVLVGEYADKDLQLAASLAAHSRHPYAKAISDAWKGSLLPLTQVHEQPGLGVEAVYEGTTIRLGRSNWCGNASYGKMGSSIWLDKGDSLPQCFICHDDIRPDAKSTLERMQHKGIELHLLSGDQSNLVEATARTLGIPHYQSQLLPGQKSETVSQLKTDGKTVLMAGDGLNDAPALAAAHVSVSPASGMDITQNTADIVFQGESLAAVTQAHRMAIFSTRLVKQNFALAAAYNLIAIPLAVMGYVTPLIAALAMSGSSLIVIANAFRIHLIKDPQRWTSY